jgi:hypothetical protein
MRTIARVLINLGLLAGTLTAMYWAMTRPSWQHASPHAHDVTVIVIGAAGLAIACIALHLVPSKAKLKRKQPTRPSFTYAAPAKRGR